MTIYRILMANRNQMNSVPAIKTINLSKRFGKRVAVDNLNLTIKQGELYCLLGDNGAGKTTTLNMLTTLLKPSAGEFYISGFNGLAQSEKTKGVFGVVSQDVAIYQELTAYENLSFIASLHRLPSAKGKARIEALLAQAGLSDRAHDIVHTFSGGMQRRLTIVMALLHEPSVLFMDEPTVGLDPAARRHIWSTLSSLREHGVTILLTTHYLAEAEILADRIGIIRQGKLVIEGTMDELRDKIQAIRSIEVRLSDHLSQEEMQAKIASAQNKLKMNIEHDAIHNTLVFFRTENGKQTSASETESKAVSGHNVDQKNKLLLSLQSVLDWLKSENIAFITFATEQPSLEEVFLAVTKGQ